jgi:pilus assembly protein Flp/PilA
MIDHEPSRRRPRIPGRRGQTLVEYALIIAFISVVAIATLISLGGQVSGTYTTIDRQLNAAQNGGNSGRH